MKYILFSLAVLAVLIAACDAPEPTATAVVEAPTPTSEVVATATPESITVTEAATSSVESSFASGGLGQDESWWETNYGPGVDDSFGEKYGNYTVLFMDGYAFYIERQWPASQALTVEEALAEGQQFVPSDAVEVETYSPNGSPETTVNLFMSPSLAEHLEADAFIGGEPGNFTIQYNTFEGQVTRMIVALGNNP
jgi:hypothetical protein